jgi:medium-chain acyl-[acyl-carrier-protein] hydrolase
VAAMVRSGRAAGTGGAWLVGAGSVGAGSVGAGLVGAGPSRRVPSHTRRADRLQLICFPFAGGGPAAFSTWPGLLPPDVDVLCVQPPGRGERLAEPPLRRLDDLVDDLVDALLRADPTAAPTVFFGHSLGAVAAFEVARSLRRRGHPSPDRLLVSGAAAPQTPNTAQVHRMSDEDLLEHTRALGGTPDELLRDPKLRAVVLPALRADFAMHETYRYRPEPPLDCPVTAFAGTDDAEVPPTEAALWRTQTTAGFDLHPLPGGHFFLHSARAALLGLIAEALAPLRGAYR